jgi:acyl-CoA hydrolase
MSTTASRFDDSEALVDAILARVGRHIVAGLPLGLGKPNHVVNALYRRACREPDIQLTLFTALTLEAPPRGSGLQARFLDPLRERFFGGYPPLEYAAALRDGSLPTNVRVVEFFLQPGAWLNVDAAQQAYTSVNYTHALDAMLRQGMNLLLQLVAVPDAPDAPEAEESSAYSLSCNPDISADLLDLRRSGHCDFLSVAQVNHHLPWLGGAALRPHDDFDLVLDAPGCDFALFQPPLRPASLVDHAIALRTAALVADGGTLQIGIGSIGDAIAHALILRHRHNARYREIADRLGISPASIPGCETAPFEEGLYGLTEMLVEGFLALMQAGLLRREVDGATVHAGFFLGSPVFHRLLADLSAAQRAGIAMMPVSFINELYEGGPYSGELTGRFGVAGSEAGKRAARQDARFINSAMMVTLSGAVVSDGLADARVVSGVGGQYNFVAQSFALRGARSVIVLPATRTRRGRTESNLCWQYPHTTIPRHLRDIVVTEYGAADLRDRSDADVIAALIGIADSRFQPGLLDEARRAGKLPADFTLPEAQRHNTPERLRATLLPYRDQLPAFPLGSGLSAEEEALAGALSRLSDAAGSKRAMARLALRGWRRRPDAAANRALARMGLAPPQTLKEHLYRRLLLATLDQGDAP